MKKKLTKLTTKINTLRVEPTNFQHLLKESHTFGSRSAYINQLISRDRGLKNPSIGYWKPKAK